MCLISDTSSHSVLWKNSILGVKCFILRIVIISFKKTIKTELLCL